MKKQAKIKKEQAFTPARVVGHYYEFGQLY